MKARYALAAAAWALATAAVAQGNGSLADAHLQLPAPWGMRNATPARTGQSPALGAVLGQLEWKTSVAGHVPQIAVAADGSIYLGTVFNENNWNNESLRLRAHAPRARSSGARR